MAIKNGGSAVLNVGRKSASLDHWVGPSQHIGTGVSTDPAMRDACEDIGVTRGGSSKQAKSMEYDA